MIGVDTTGLAGRKGCICIPGQGLPQVTSVSPNRAQLGACETLEFWGRGLRGQRGRGAGANTTASVREQTVEPAGGLAAAFLGSHPRVASGPNIPYSLAPSLRGGSHPPAPAWEWVNEPQGIVPLSAIRL